MRKSGGKVMKTKLKCIATVMCASVFALSLSACGRGKSTLLGKSAKPEYLSYTEKNTDEFLSFKNGVDKFASSFAEYAYGGRQNSNFAVSPVSVYMALSLAAECADGQTRSEILSALGVSYESLKTNFPLLYRSVWDEHKSGKKVTGRIIPANSIWVNKGTPVNPECIDALSKYYYCDSYSADFYGDNAQANKAVRYYVKQQTDGLIDKDFELSEDTLFALINTLYLKTVWNERGDDLRYAPGLYEFKNGDGTTVLKNLLSGYYNTGRAYVAESYKSFYTTTYDGYKIKFIVPCDGYSISDVFTAENISHINAVTDYNDVDDVNKLRYSTRCIFPEYECNFDEEINGILTEKYGVDKLFKDPGIYADACGFSNLSEEKCYCAKIRHVAKLNINKKGVEGAAVTVIEMDGATAPDPGEYTPVFENFVVDRAFGFVITTPENIALFSGVINKL